MKALSLIGALLVSWAGIASAVIVSTTVDGMAGPWQWESGGLNTVYQYCYGEQAAPTVISQANGFRFAVGDNLTLSYVSGSVAIGLFSPSFDALGDAGYPLNDQTNKRS